MITPAAGTSTRQSRYNARKASEPNTWKCVSMRPPVRSISSAEVSICATAKV